MHLLISQPSNMLCCGFSKEPSNEIILLSIKHKFLYLPIPMQQALIQEFVKETLWVLKRSVSKRWFLSSPKIYVKIMGKKITSLR